MESEAEQGELFECWECWNVYRIYFGRQNDGPLASLGPSLALEYPCPYCRRPNEFRVPISRIELLSMSEPARRLRVARRRLSNAGVDLGVRIGEGKRRVAAIVTRLSAWRAEEA